MALQLYNTDGRELQTFKELEKGKVRLYGCGPTVYNYAHIGNMRAYVFEDILRRTLEFLDYDVIHAMNITDVGHLTDDGDDGEDKMIKAAREKGMSVWDIAEFFTEAFFIDAEKLNIKNPHIVCKATEHIEDMIDLVKRLEAKGYTYLAGGNVYFSIDKFPEYGRMALLDKADLQSGARIGIDKHKKNPRDFVLWFTNSKFDNQAMTWDSPWGKGYPGWHLECSAMSMKYLGENFDIHCGGIDHVNVHHTNEIAQSEAATGKKWVNFWLHNEFLLMDTGRMSKSSGNFLTISSLEEEGYAALDFRYFLLGAHYRSQLMFKKESLDAARNARAKLNAQVLSLKKSGSHRVVLTEAAKLYCNEFLAALSDDLNTPKALAAMWKTLKSSLPSEQKLALLYEMDGVLGLGLDGLKEDKAVELPADIQALIEQRGAARQNKDWAESDRIRDLLKEKGILVKDTANGTEWKKL